MNYISTRGGAPPASFEDVLLRALAPDGGLYLPEQWPQLPPLKDFSKKPYAEVAFQVMRPFTGDAVSADVLRRIINRAAAAFSHDAVAPLTPIGERGQLLELFHGPTLSFKDVAMQVLAGLFEHVLETRRQSATLIVATSGDTGSAAIHAFENKKHIQLFVMHPKGRISDVQRRQMTACSAPNIHNIAVNGTFDDCQAIVKGLFANRRFSEDTRLTGVNSINWARIMAQIPYYITAAAASPQPVSFAVPTGNFGDIFAGYAASRMGMPVERFIIATNDNDILARTLGSGRYQTAPVAHTSSPAMDIQVASNFERLLFEAMDRDGGGVAQCMQTLRMESCFDLPQKAITRIRALFDAASANEQQTQDMIATLHRETGILPDPHTAVGLCAAEATAAARNNGPVVVLATAHPAKFPDVVRRATGQAPPVPAAIADLSGKQEHCTTLANDLAAAEQFIRDTIRRAS